MKAEARSLATLLVFALIVVGCGGGGRSIAGGSLPSSGSAGSSANHNVSITLSIPGGNSASGTSITHRSPQTISAATQSIVVTVNGGTPQIFNVNSQTCTSGSNGMTCTLVVGAPFGNDGFLVITYSGQNGLGTALNAAAFTLNVTQAGTNSASATAGNLIIVNSSGDGSGSGFSCSGGTCTLREAVAEASTTTGVYTAIMFQNVSTITVASQIEIGKSAAQNIILLGPGATVPSPGTGAPTASSNLTLSGGNSSGILMVDPGSFLSVVGLTLANGNNTVDVKGGAIENNGGLAVINAIFSGNTTGASGYGGAIYDNGTGSGSTIVTSTFTNNVAENGGGYFGENLAAGASFSHCLFNTNTAFYAPDLYGEGGAIDTYANLTVDSSTFTGNVAGSTSVSGIEGDGGALAIWNNTASPSVTNSTFGGSASTGNFAGGPGGSDFGFGGAIENDGSNPITLSGNTFSYNVAKGGYEAYGGAVDDYLGVMSTGDTFSNNTDDSSASTSSGFAYGGAIQTSGITTLTSDTFSGNSALGGPAATASGQAYGGAIYEDGFALTGSQTTFSNNRAVAGYACDGGGVYVFDNALGDVISFSNVQFTNNTCSASQTTSSAYAYGGGLEVDYAYASLSNVTFSGNTASAASDGVTYIGYAYGGGFEYYDGQGSSCRLCSTAHRTPPSSTESRASSAIQQKLNTLAANQTRLTQDFARRQSSRSRRHAGNKIASVPMHRASDSSRRTLGAVPSSNLTNVTFSANTASGGPSGYAYGGGADLSGTPTVSASLNNNTATTSGTGGNGVGGGFSNGGSGFCGTFAFTGTISSNSASNEGGGIWNQSATCTLTVSGSSISGNSVTAVAMVGNGGGGIWNEGNLTLTQSTLSGNTVAPALAGTGGGGLYDYFGYSTITNSTIASNTSSTDGGGIELHNSFGAGIVNATVYGNSATGSGGNLYDYAATLLSNQGNIFASGIATGSGPDVAVDSVQFASAGYNLIATNFGFLNNGSYKGGTGDLIASGAPVLSQTTFTANGVTMLIYAEQTSSPTKDAIPLSVCTGMGITVDQRGNPRGDGGDNLCDIGAYEFP